MEKYNYKSKFIGNGCVEGTRSVCMFQLERGDSSGLDKSGIDGLGVGPTQAFLSRRFFGPIRSINRSGIRVDRGTAILTR